MTNNVRLLSRRPQPPLRVGHGSGGRPPLPYSLKFVTKAATLDTLSIHDLSPNVIKEYLDKNPDFLENYLINSTKYRNSFKLRHSESRASSAENHKMSSILKSPFVNGFKDDQDIVLFNEFATRLTDEERNPSLQNRELYIHKLMHTFEESFPKASIMITLQKCLNESMKVDGVKFFFIDSKRESVYLYDPTEMNHEFNSKEVFSLIKINTPSALATAQNRCVTFPNMKANTYSYLTKYKSDYNVMSQPITNFSGAVFGAIELYRDRNKIPFSKSEEDILLNYITWTSITLYFSEILSKNNQQQQLNNIIMRVTQTMFSNFRYMDNVIMDIMKYTKKIVKAQRSAFFVVEKKTQEVIAKIFDIGNEFETIFSTSNDKIRFPIGVGIVGHVAATGEALNISDVYDDVRFNRDIDLKTGYTTKSLLTIPIKLKNEVVGVIQIVNKTGGIFTKVDEENLGTFGTYCGIALYISKMYQTITLSEQKYKVALDVLSYHSGYDREDYLILDQMVLPTHWPELCKYSFGPWDIDEMKQILAVMSMFQELFGIFSLRDNTENVFKSSLRDNSENVFKSRYDCKTYRFEKQTLMKFILTVKKNYRKVPYHNWGHAFSVGHAIYCILIKTTHQFTLLEALALFVSCLCHDLDHRGKTNEYMVKSDVSLGSLYSTSTMEHHHFNTTVQLLQRDDHNIFEYLPPDDYKTVLSYMKSNILATDLGQFFLNVAKINNFINNNEVDWKNEDQRKCYMELCMTASDLCSMFKPWDMQLRHVRVIMEEFWDQGDLEKKRGEVPIRMMDRDFYYDLPDLEIGFIGFICLPCYTALSKIVYGASGMVDGAEMNLAQWKILKTLTKEEFKGIFS